MEFEQNLSIQRELLWNRQYISIALSFCLFLNGLNVTIVDSRRSLCTSSDVSQTYNFPVFFFCANRRRSFHMFSQKFRRIRTWKETRRWGKILLELTFIMSSIFLGIVGLQKDLSLLTTKRLYSKSGVVNDRKFRDRVEEVD